MNHDSQEKLEVSKDIVKQLNAMVRNCAATGFMAPTPPPNVPNWGFGEGIGSGE